MGWFSRLFGSDPTTRIEKARKLLSRGEYNDARWELEDLDHPDAAALLDEARAGLVVLNLDEARAKFTAGDPDGAREHLEIAREFGATPDDLRDARRYGRTLREEAEAEKRAKAMQPIAPEGDDPLWGLPPDDPRLQYAMRLETWPETLRFRLSQLGAGFAQAVMAIDEGRAAAAWEALGPYVAQEPAARFERARAALETGRLPQAAEDLHHFAEQVGHQRIGNHHTGVLHAQLLARLGRADEALDMLAKTIRKDDAIDLRGARASLLEVTGDLENARLEAESLLTKAPKDQGLYRLLARVREGLGDRDGAVYALETSLACTCGSPGKCGQQAYDVHAARMLARLYLEDRQAPARVEELLTEVARNIEKPEWDDRYLEALVARNDGNARVDEMVHTLRSALAPGDPRAAWLDRAFASAAG